MAKQIKETIKRAELDVLREDLPKLKQISGTKIAYAVASLREVFQAEMKIVGDHQQPKETPEILAYREEIQKKYQESLYKDEKGENLVDNNGNVRLKDPKAFEKEVMEILEKHPVAKEAIQKHEDEYNLFVEEEVELVYNELKVSDLPDTLNYEELTLLQKYWNALKEEPRRLEK